MKKYQKYSTLLSLYLAQSVPMSFFSTVLPVILRREGFTLGSIAFFQLIKLPWILKFLWAPLIDKNSQKPHHYRRWIFASEFFYAAVMVAISFFHLKTDLTLILGLMVLAIFLSATQDIASDAFAIKLLKKSERGPGNSMQGAGSFLGALFGSGILLALYDWLGWQPILWLLGGMVLLGVLPLYLFKSSPQEEKEDIEKTANPVKSQGYRSIWTFFTISGMKRRIPLLLFFYTGVMGILTLLKPFLVDLGYSNAEIASISGIFGTSMGALGSLIAGRLIKKLATRNSLYLFAVFNIIAAAFFYLATRSTPSTPILYMSVGLIWFSYAMSSVAIYTISMEMVRPGCEGTDYSFQIVFLHLGGILMAVFSGKFADHFGYHNFFLIEIALGILVVAFLPVLYKAPVNPIQKVNNTFGKQKKARHERHKRISHSEI